MLCVVPLAGPDFVDKKGKIKALKPFMNGFLLKKVLESRHWFHEISSYHFILQNNNIMRNFYASTLKDWFPNSCAAFITPPTRGAVMSVLSGVSMINNFNAPIVVDLADIYYESNNDIASVFSCNPDIGAVALTFKSTKDCYSYFRFSSNIFDFESREKEVISSDASAGTYIFKNLPVLLYSLYYSIKNVDHISYNDLLYICPALNSLKELNLRVVGVDVCNVIDVKTDL